MKERRNEVQRYTIHKALVSLTNSSEKKDNALIVQQVLFVNFITTKNKIGFQFQQKFKKKLFEHDFKDSSLHLIVIPQLYRKYDRANN